MAKYLAGGRVRGTLHGVTYQRNLYTGWIAKEKSSITAEQIATSPAFQRTRENNNEMKGVGFAVKALRGSLSQFLPFVTDPIVTGRMIREVKKAQLKSTGIRGQRKIGFEELCKAMQGFQVSNVYPTDKALRSLQILLAETSPASNEFKVTALCNDIVWPAGANCGIPFVTTIEVDDIEYFSQAGVWDFSHISLGEYVRQNVIMQSAFINFEPTEETEIDYGNQATNIRPNEFKTTLNVDSTLDKNSDEFGQVLVWFGVQFGQLVEITNKTGNIKHMQFYPLRGATAGLVAGTVMPSPAG